MLRNYVLWLGLFLVTVSVQAQSKYQRAEELYEQAQQAYRTRNYNEALDLVNRSMQLTPTANAAYLSGLVHEAMGRDLRAVSSYEATLKLDPRYDEAIFQKAIIYLNYGDPAQAHADLSVLINTEGVTQTRGVYFEVDPSGQEQNQILSVNNLRSKLFHYRGQASEKLGEYDAALADYNEALRMDTLTAYLISRALLHEKMNNQEGALADLKLAIAIDRGNQLAWYNLALLDPSVALPDDLLGEESFGPTLSLLASRAMSEGNYILAKKYFDRSIENDDADALSYINRGRILLKMNQFVPARADFNEASRLEPGRIEIYYLIGNSYFYEKNFERAAAYYNQYLTADPTNGMVWYNGAMSYLEMDNAEEACHYLQRANTLGMLQAEKVLKKYCR
ncbi:MAG: tetratricopeptide repeat protein [Marinoscillum sp.]|uniref:tetratricopeptide repeat protein n=1 Tax=Marinoscillum sp. TaxID=2024838 RepID=UPI003300612D